MTSGVRWAILAVVLILAGLWATLGRRTDVPPLPAAGSRLLVEPAQIDLGDVKAMTWHEITLNLRNPTDRPIRILKLAARCGCIATVSEMPRVAAGSQVPFTFKYRSRDDAVRDNSAVEFWTDESAESKALMSIASHAQPGIVAEPDLLSFGELKPGQRKEQVVTLRHLKGTPFRVLGVSSDPSSIATESHPLEGGDGSRWRIVVTCEGGAQGQFLQGTCAVQTDCQDAPRVVFRIAATVTGNILIEPKLCRGVARADGMVGPWEVTLRRVTPGKIKIKTVKETGLRPVEYRTSGDGDDVNVSLSFTLAEPIAKPIQGLFVLLIENEPAALNIPYVVSPPLPATPRFAAPATR